MNLVTFMKETYGIYSSEGSYYEFHIGKYKLVLNQGMKTVSIVTYKPWRIYELDEFLTEVDEETAKLFIYNLDIFIGWKWC